MRYFRRLYDWVLTWAETPYGVPALFILAAIEACFFPIPPDVLLLALGIALPRRAFWFALVATLGSVGGGMVGYLFGYGLWEVSADFFYRYIPGFSPAQFERVQELFEQFGFWTIFAAGFTPIPFKVFTVAAGVFQINFWVFVAASLTSRGLRFFLLAAFLRLFGAPVRVFIERYFNLLTWLALFLVLLLVGLYQWFR